MIKSLQANILNTSPQFWFSRSIVRKDLTAEPMSVELLDHPSCTGVDGRVASTISAFIAAPHCHSAPLTATSCVLSLPWLEFLRADGACVKNSLAAPDRRMPAKAAQILPVCRAPPLGLHLVATPDRPTVPRSMICCFVSAPVRSNSQSKPSTHHRRPHRVLRISRRSTPASSATRTSRVPTHRTPEFQSVSIRDRYPGRSFAPKAAKRCTRHLPFIVTSNGGHRKRQRHTNICLCTRSRITKPNSSASLTATTATSQPTNN